MEPGPVARGEGRLRLLHESASVDEAGQRIVERLVAQLDLQGTTLVDIALEQTDQAGQPGQDQEGQQRGGGGHDGQATRRVRTQRHEERTGDHRDRETDHPDRTEPGDGDRVRIGQPAHRRVEDRRPERQIRQEVQRVDRAAGDIRSLEVLEGVDLVGDDQQEERPGQQAEGGRPSARRGQQAHGHADEQEVGERVRQADADVERIEFRPDELRLDEERPRQDRAGGRQDRGIEEAAAVTAAHPATDEQEQAGRDERVAREVQHVGERREWVLADHLVPVPHDVAGDERGLADGHEHPRHPTIGRVADDPDDGGRDGRRADDVVEPALLQATGREGSAWTTSASAPTARKADQSCTPGSLRRDIRACSVACDRPPNP